MKKGLIVGIFLLFIVLMLSFVSAGFFSDLWAKITGKAFDVDCPIDCPPSYECGYYYQIDCPKLSCGDCGLHEQCISNQCQTISYSSITNCNDCISLGYVWCIGTPSYCGEYVTSCSDNYTTSLATCEYIKCIDNDGDGYNVENQWEELLGFDCGPVDCDDNNAGIHPGATDICENGIDEDCVDGDATCAPIVSCTNNDEGPDEYYIASYATDSDETIPDTCDSTNVLREAICVGPFGATAPYATTVTYDCSIEGKVCEDRRCVTPTITCVDNDGRNYYNASSATGSSGTVYDECTSATILKEAYCGGATTNVLTISYDCSTEGKVCLESKCVTPTPATCDDTDGGIILNEFGTASDSSGTEISDDCLDENTLIEASCGPSNTVVTTTESCIIGEELCKVGRCIPCQDKDNDGYYDQGGECGTTADCRDDLAAVNPGVAENTNTRCSDGLDNDCDNLIDCDDSGCACTAAITVCCECPTICPSSYECGTYFVSGCPTLTCGNYNGGCSSGYECENHQCIESTPTCVDNDEGSNQYYIASSATDLGGSLDDDCYNSIWLDEAICYNGGTSLEYYNCADEGMVCEDGACVPSSCPSVCPSSYECGTYFVSGCPTLTCGNYNGGCSSGYECENHQCVASVCTDTCSSLGYECGDQIVCGEYKYCGPCGTNEVCQGGNCVYQEPSCTDNDGDNYSPDGGNCGEVDCNDNNAAINPGAAEICDGIDNDCDNNIDEGVKNTYYRDADGDGYGDSSETTQACSRPSGYVLSSSDCDDGNSNIHPGADEIPNNGIDEDCVNGDYETTQLPSNCLDCVDGGYTWCFDNTQCLEPGESCSEKANHDYECPSCIKAYGLTQLGLSSTTGIGKYLKNIESGCALTFNFGNVLETLPAGYTFSVPNTTIVKILNISSSNSDKSAEITLNLNENEFRWPLQNMDIYIEETKTTWTVVPKAQRQLEKLTSQGEGVYSCVFSTPHFSLFLLTEPNFCGNGAFESTYYEECDGSEHCTSECTCEVGYVPDGSGNCVEEAENKECSVVGGQMCIGFNLYECGTSFSWIKKGIVIGNCSVECAPIGNKSCDGEIPLKCGSDYRWYSQEKVSGECGYVAPNNNPDPNLQDCGDGYCGYYEDEFNCPEDCTEEKASSKWILFLVIGIIILLIIIVAVFFFRIYNKERKKKPKGPGKPDRKIPPAHRPGPKREPGRPPVIHHGQIGRPPERMVRPDRRVPPAHRPGPKRPPGRPTTNKYPVQRYPR